MTQLPISIEGGTAPSRGGSHDGTAGAELLGVPLSTVHEWERRGVLPRIKLGGHVRFVRAAGRGRHPRRT